MTSQAGASLRRGSFFFILCILLSPQLAARQNTLALRETGLDDIRFLWIGGLDRGEGHYYRVQGGGILIEYDNTQNNNNHIHLVWRDFDGDFGRDLLREHYEQVAAAYGPGHRH